MAKKPKTAANPNQTHRSERGSNLATDEAVTGIPGPGQWLVFEYQPTALFSLKISMATSSVGKTLVVPSPYAVKMAFVDAAFRTGFPDDECDRLLRSLASITLRIAPPQAAVVTHTFVKVRQEPHDPREDPLRPYIGSIAYREVVSYSGLLRWAFDMTNCDQEAAERLVRIAPHINYVGKRGSFVQYLRVRRLTDLDAAFTQPLENERAFALPARAHIVPLDDFGPEANLQVLSSYTPVSPKRGKHRKFVHTVVPLGIVNTGPGFTEYRA